MDLLGLAKSPDRVLKSSKVLTIAEAVDELATPKRRMSSVKNKCEILFLFLVREKGVQLLSIVASSILLESLSIQRIKI